MNVACTTPTPEQLPVIGARLARWQGDPWAGHLHPGDLGWHSSVGHEQMAGDLRVWRLDGEPVAIGMLDGSDVLRMAVAPEWAHDQALAQRIAGDLNQPAAEFATGHEVIVEVRGASALRRALKSAGWFDDEPWTPMTLALTSPLDLDRLETAHLHIVEVGPEGAADWTSVHWSSFTGTPYTEDARSRFTARWTQIMSGPFADRAHSLIAYDANGVPVAVTTVWTAGAGRPGLVEPMGVHREHHGRGYATAITLAGAESFSDRVRARRPSSQRTPTQQPWPRTAPPAFSRKHQSPTSNDPANLCMSTSGSCYAPRAASTDVRARGEPARQDCNHGH